jgi:hypothetical protein
MKLGEVGVLVVQFRQLVFFRGELSLKKMDVAFSLAEQVSRLRKVEQTAVLGVLFDTADADKEIRVMRVRRFSIEAGIDRTKMARFC